ncbi:MAG: RNA polymerase sigma factor [Blastocatellia bacterium]
MKQGDDRSAQSTARHIVAGEPHEETNPVGFYQAAGGPAGAPAGGRPGGESGRAAEDEAPAGGPGEDELVSRTLAGDQDAFEVLVRRNSPRVFSIIGSFFRRRDMVEDIAQEVFAKAYFSLSTFTLGRSFEAWVAKIAVNACYDHLRSQRRRIEQQIPHESQEEDGWLELQMLEVARDRHASSERQRDAAEIADRLLAKLEPEDRIVIVLMDRDGYSVKEVSEMTGWGQSKVKVRAFRARRVLRAAMKRLVLSGERMQRSKQ